MVHALSLLALILATLGGAFLVKRLDQAARDNDRRTYRLMFPSDLDPDRVTAWIRALTGTLKTGMTRLSGVETVALEVIATSQGITYRLKVPWKHRKFILGQLNALVPGVGIQPEDEWPAFDFNRAVEIGLTNSSRLLHIDNPVDISHSILASLKSVSPGEVVMLQWVVTPAIPTHKPVHSVSKTNELKHRHLITGDLASRDEVDERRKKLEEPNMLAVLRVGAKSGTTGNADQLLNDVKAALTSIRGPSTKFTKRLASTKEVNARMRKASGSVTFPIQLSASELAALIAWPLNNPMIQGLPMSPSRRIPAPDVVLRQGRVLGMSNFYGQERPVALGYTEALTHMQILGSTGTGKTTLLANMLKQDMDAGHGVILIEAKGDLFRAALNYVPKNRINDVIVLDVNDTTNPVGFNVLRQGNPSVVVDDLNLIFNQLFTDNQSLWMRELMYHGLHTLAEDPDAAFTDLASLVWPDDTEREWRDRLISQVRDPQLRAFWKRFDSFPPARREQMVQPVLSRVWPMSRTKLLNIVGQSSSSFLMDDVIRQNKILLVNLSGIERDAASLMGTLIMNATWNSVKSVQSQTPTFLYMDEAHHYVNLPFDLEQMLVEARSMKLGMVLAHQYNEQLPASTKAAVMNSARTKIVFHTNDTNAREMARAMGGTLDEKDLTGLAAYEAIARVATPSGIAAPFSMSTLPPERPAGTSGEVLRASRQTYGRAVAEVRDQIIERRQAARPSSGNKRPPISGGWGQPLA